MSYNSWSEVAEKYNYRFSMVSNTLKGMICIINIYDNKKSSNDPVILKRDISGEVNYNHLIKLIDDYLLDIRDKKIESILK